jgi:rare lipoprotein A
MPSRSGGGRGFFAALLASAGLVTSLLLLATVGFAVSGCGGRGNNERLGERVIPLGQPVPKGGGYYTVGKPYEIGGAWYTPREDPNYDRVGSASWYGELFHGRRTANGEIYDMDRLSAAHPTLPLPVYARVTNLNNGRSIVVRINDRGPYARDRIIDLSRRSAELLAFRSHGTATVRVKYLGRAPLSGDDSYERRYLANQSWVYFAAKKKSPKGALDLAAIAKETLPAENPENLARPWKESAPHNVALHNDADPGNPATQDWKATTKTSLLPPPQTTGSIQRNEKALARGDGPVVQAGSFKNKENAERARNVLSAIAPVDIAPVTVGQEVYFRVRVGPFSSASEARAALAKVAEAGYRGAKVVTKH